MVSARQFNRGIRITVIPPLPVGGTVSPPVVINPIPPLPAGKGPPQIHVRFSVSSSLTPEPQRAAIDAWNLQKLTRDSIAGASRRVTRWADNVVAPFVKVDGRFRPGDPIVTDTTSGVAHVTLEAGYDGNLSRIFAGTCSPVRNRRVGGVDWITSMIAGDSELSMTQGVASQTFAPGTPAAAVVTYLASVMGLTVAPTVAFGTLGGFLLKSGLVAVGRARDGLRDLLGAAGLSWWVEDGVLYILGDGEFVPGLPVFTSPEDVPGAHQLLESPMPLDDGGVRVKMQLAPEVRPGHQLLIASSEVAGAYRIEHTTHTGDNRSGPFTTEAIVRSQNPLG